MKGTHPWINNSLTVFLFYFFNLFLFQLVSIEFIGQLSCLHIVSSMIKHENALCTKVWSLKRNGYPVLFVNSTDLTRSVYLITADECSRDFSVWVSRVQMPLSGNTPVHFQKIPVEML